MSQTTSFSREGALRSRRKYITIKDEVHSDANDWLRKSLRLKYDGTKCTADTLIQLLSIAAARATSIYAACRDLADAPCDQTIRNALEATFPGVTELERRLNRALATELPKALFRISRRIAIDLVLIPYHGHRDTLALTRVERGEKMKLIVHRLLATVRQRQVSIRFVLLDKGFFSVEVVSYLKRAQVGFMIPVMVRGRKPKPGKKATSLRAIRKKKDDYYQPTLNGKVNGKQRSIKVAAKGKWDSEPQLFLELLRFGEMLLWISQVIGKVLGANQSNGIEYEAYQRLTGID